MRSTASTGRRATRSASRRFTTSIGGAPDVTRRRLNLETMQRILPRVGLKVFVANDTTGVLPLLTLDSVTPRPALAPAPAAAPAAGGDQ